MSFTGDTNGRHPVLLVAGKPATTETCAPFWDSYVPAETWRAPSGAEHAATGAYHAAKKAGTRQQSSVVVCSVMG
ncbi:hypothetical protein BM1_01487 [Bipolaris maydis]|nr:hypothetical protein BM1_01487 [Bipolaris maydis]